MMWINIKDELPVVKGNYIVETITYYSKRRLETSFNGKKFDVNNQVVVRWLKEEL